MKYRALGNTGLNVSALSFGASSLGGVFHKVDEQQCVQTVHEALELGINYIDVSPYYGLTKAETMLGKAIKHIPRDRFILSTKAGRYDTDVFNFSKSHIIQSVEESLRRLHTDYIDLLFLHDVEFVPAEVILEEAIPALDQLKRDGKIRFQGISGLPLAVFEYFLPKIELDVILSYCHYTLNDTTLLHLLPLLEQKQVGLVNASPLSMGLLSSREPAAWHPASEKLKKVCKQAAEHCERHGENIAKLAIQFSTSNDRVPTTLVSTANPENIRKNVEWMTQNMNTDLFAEVQNILGPVMNKSWISGRPEYNQKINV